MLSLRDTYSVFNDHFPLDFIRRAYFYLKTYLLSLSLLYHIFIKKTIVKNDLPWKDCVTSSLGFVNNRPLTLPACRVPTPMPVCCCLTTVQYTAAPPTAVCEPLYSYQRLYNYTDTKSFVCVSLTQKGVFLDVIETKLFRLLLRAIHSRLHRGLYSPIWFSWFSWEF